MNNAVRPTSVSSAEGDDARTASRQPLSDVDAQTTGHRPDQYPDAWSRAGVCGLSPREYEIVRLVADDRSNKQISMTLGISVWTVSTHVRRIFAKLDVHSRAAMVAAVLDGHSRAASSEMPGPRLEP